MSSNTSRTMRPSLQLSDGPQPYAHYGLILIALNALFWFLLMGAALLAELLVGLHVFLTTPLGGWCLVRWGHIVVVAVYGSIFAPLLGLTIEWQETILKSALAGSLRRVQRALRSS